MYAIIQTGGKQYKVSKGDNIQVELLPDDIDSKVNFDKVLMLNDDGRIEIGTPYLENVQVFGKVVSSGKKDKIKVVKFKRRKRYARTAGHRQSFSEIEITDIQSSSDNDKEQMKSTESEQTPEQTSGEENGT